MGLLTENTKCVHGLSAVTVALTSTIPITCGQSRLQ